jgi:hypothetical protein
MGIHMLTAGKLQDVIDAGVPFTWAEAVAVVQQAIASYERERAGAPNAPRLENLWLSPDGAVLCDGCMPALTVGDAAALLDALLRHAGATNLPGGLQYTLARATRQVDAPPLDSIAALATALCRHERGERSTVLRELYSRAIDLPPRTAAAPQIPRAASVPSPTHIPEGALTRIGLAREEESGSPRVTRRPAVAERRRTGPSVDELRRELRAADAELFDADPVLAGTEADTPPRLPPLADSEVRPHRRRWILGGITAAMIAFGVGYGCTYEWQHRGVQPNQVQVLPVASPTLRGSSTVDAPRPADDPFTADRSSVGGGPRSAPQAR